MKTTGTSCHKNETLGEENKVFKPLGVKEYLTLNFIAFGFTSSIFFHMEYNRASHKNKKKGYEN
jgi:hypothetical protein